MPKLNGKQVYDAISRIRPDIKTLFISGYPYEVMSGQGVLEAGKPFISKPLPPGALLMKLREIIEN
jgi:YesN/AraC family two-component response regulator